MRGIKSWLEEEAGLVFKNRGGCVETPRPQLAPGEEEYLDML